MASFLCSAEKLVILAGRGLAEILPGRNLPSAISKLLRCSASARSRQPSRSAFYSLARLSPAMATVSPIMRQLGCFRSLLKPQFFQPVQFSRSLSTVYSPKPEPVALPTQIPKSMLSQLPARMQPTFGRKKLRAYPPPASASKACKNPVDAVAEAQMATLDPTGERKALFDYRRNPRSVKPGDILRVTFKNGDPFSGVCLSIRLRGIDTSFLLRNEITRVGVEMWVKVFSPNVESVEVVQRSDKRKRRARLYYMRQPRHDMRSVENIVSNYLRQKSALAGGRKNRQR